MTSYPSCFDCVHFIGEGQDKEKGEYRCKAFRHIPEEILQGKKAHIKPLPQQQNNVVFEQY